VDDLEGRAHSQADIRPSAVTAEPYLYAKRRHHDYPRHTENGGKWLIFVPTSEVDEVWATIKQATQDGQLGGLSKVATAYPNPLTIHAEKRVICVYTYDSQDETDVMRVRAELRRLGVIERITYKPDAATRAGAYSKNCGKRVGKYRT
jgi:hypothetical protein